MAGQGQSLRALRELALESEALRLLLDVRHHLLNEQTAKSSERDLIDALQLIHHATMKVLSAAFCRNSSSPS